MKIAAIILIAVTCILLQSVHAATFECNHEPSVCKTIFGIQFEKDFKELHLTAMRKFFSKFIDFVDSIKSQLTREKDEKYVKTMENSITNVKNGLQKLNDNVNDEKKIAEAIEETLETVMLRWEKGLETKEYDFLITKERISETLPDILRKLAVDTATLWAEMYSGLREKDLKAYPEYTEVNEYMEDLRGDGKSPGKALNYSWAARILAEKFNLPYFAAITDIN